MYECRCDERLKTKSEEVNRRDVSECDVCVCVLEVIGVPSKYLVYY